MDEITVTTDELNRVVSVLLPHLSPLAAEGVQGAVARLQLQNETQARAASEQREAEANARIAELEARMADLPELAPVNGDHA